jgi:hypothetical protein
MASITNTRTTTTLKKSAHQYTIALLAGCLIVSVLIIIALLSKQDKPSTELAEQPNSILSSDQLAKANTFKRDDVELTYPKNVKIVSTLDTGSSNSITFEIAGGEVVFGRSVSRSGNVPPYMKTSVTKTYNNIPWKVVDPSMTSEFCDAGTCGKTSASYYTHKNGYIYSFIFDTSEQQPAIEQMLETLRFTK